MAVGTSRLADGSAGDEVQVLAHRTRQHPQEDDAVVLDGDDFGHSGVGFLVAHHHERPDGEVDAGLGIPAWVCTRPRSSRRW